MRKTPRVIGVQPDQAEQLHHPRLTFIACPDTMNVKRVADGLADRDPRIERSMRVLEDHLHPAPEPPQLWESPQDVAFTSPRPLSGYPP